MIFGQHGLYDELKFQKYFQDSQMMFILRLLFLVTVEGREGGI